MSTEIGRTITQKQADSFHLSLEKQVFARIGYKFVLISPQSALTEILNLPITVLIFGRNISAPSQKIDSTKDEGVTMSENSKRKCLAVFLDGTWNTSLSNTNVWRLKSLCPSDEHQRCLLQQRSRNKFRRRNWRGKLWGSASMLKSQTHMNGLSKTTLTMIRFLSFHAMAIDEHRKSFAPTLVMHFQKCARFIFLGPLVLFF